MIIAVANQKGGVGETTTTLTLAHLLSLEGEEVAKEETTRLNAVVPVSLHKAVKIQAASEGRSITDILIDSLDGYLSKNVKQCNEAVSPTALCSRTPLHTGHTEA